MRKTKKPTCLFGKVLSEIMTKKGINPYDIERSWNISAVSIHRFMKCMRFPSPFRNDIAFSIVELAKILNLNEDEKKQLYLSLVETFYPGVSQYFSKVKEEDLTDEYIKALVQRKPATKTWTEICEVLPEPSVRKIRNLKTDISMFNSRDSLSKFLSLLNLSDFQKAQIVYYFMKKKGAHEEFLQLLKN